MLPPVLHPDAATQCRDSPTLLLMTGGGKQNQAALLNFGMEPKSFGRRMGIGVRVASRMLRDRAQGPAVAAPAAATAVVGSSSDATAQRVGSPANGTPGVSKARSKARRVVPNLAEPARRVGQGTRRFGEAFWGPLVHTGGTLWLEVTGMFFALFAFFFAQNVWKLRSFHRTGPEHAHFLLYVGLTAVFFYLCLSSFMRARRRGKKGWRR